MRPSGRDLSEMRAVSIETGFTKHAEGSCLIKMGDTHVLCTATIEDRVPPFIKGSGLGWVTAEYGMLPRATNTRMRREAASGKQGGRTVEIQRLIGRALRAGVDRVALGERQITVDCDVIQADGGTRCASITGGWVALRLAVNKLMKAGDVISDPLGRPCRCGFLRYLCGSAGAGSGLPRRQRSRRGRQLHHDRFRQADRSANERRRLGL